MGRPVASYTLEIEGLDVTDREHFQLADSAEEFAAAILTLLDDADLRTTVARNARALMEERFSWTVVARQFEAICLETMRCR